MISLLGLLLATLGSILACYGVWVFNVRKDPQTANAIWCFSNPMLCVWAIGYLEQLWDGLLPMTALALMYGYYTAASWWGWWKR